ncbi:MAG TPA: MBL fold metallo-hydrolase [Candidatus Polarisedimenticolaceae bacterium]|nr:MBL fold metallo-hydrolase [Candidatus Polarisedimenticolaceae bacterium]
MLAALLLAAAAQASPPPRLVLLGTAGGPTPKRTRAAPAQALHVNGTLYVVDCGNGAGRQMALAGLPFLELRHVFLTHHHSDHNADLVTLPLLAWAAGNESTVTLHGPRPMRRAVRAGLRAHAFDVETRTHDEGRTDLRKLLRVHAVREDGLVLDDGRVRVTAARVQHPPIEDAFAYRFDLPGWSVVFSGDTAPSETLIRLAKGADVLVHEVLLADAAEVARWLEKPPEHALVQHVVRSHTSFRDVGRVARDAGVKTLVLSHFVPGDAPVDRDAVLAEIGKSFGGKVVFGEDLMVLTPD